MSSKLSLAVFIMVWLAWVGFAGAYYINTFALFNG